MKAKGSEWHAPEDDNHKLANLCGPVDANLRQIEAALNVKIARRNGTLNVVDALGRTVLQREVRAGSLEQVTLATGAYTVRVSNAQRSGFARLLVR